MLRNISAQNIALIMVSKRQTGEVDEYTTDGSKDIRHLFFYLLFKKINQLIN